METDEALFERVRTGDARAFDTLYDRHAPPLFGFVRARLGSAAEAEDVLQEAFVAMFRERCGTETVRSVRAWLITAAGHLCANRLRSRKRSGRALEVIAHVHAGEPAQDAEVGALRNERFSALSEAVARLPDPLAEVYHLRAAGLSYEEVASALDVPLGTIKSRMSRLVEVLRTEVGR